MTKIIVAGIICTIISVIVTGWWIWWFSRERPAVVDDDENRSVTANWNAFFRDLLKPEHESPDPVTQYFSASPDDTHTGDISRPRHLRLVELDPTLNAERN